MESSSAESFVIVDGPSLHETGHILKRSFHRLEQNTYSTDSIKAIQSRRNHGDLHGQLFYDELLNLALTNKDDENELLYDQQSPSDLYPPKAGDVDSLIELLQVIQSSSFDRIKKMALCYYIILDLDHQAGSKRALQIAKEMGLPTNARYAMTGYWLLDKGDYSTAVSYLTEQPDFVSKIISTISPLPYTSTSRQETESRALALSQFLSLVDVQSLGYEPDEAFEEARVVATCWSQGLRAGWVHCQEPVAYNWNEEDPDAFRLRLIGRLLEYCFMPEPRSDAIKTLLALPLSEADEEVLCHSIMNPPSNIQLSSYAHAVAFDVLMIRRVNSGQYYDAILLDQRINSTIGLPHLSREGSNDMERERLRLLRAKREGLVRSAHSILTRVERQLLKVSFGEDDASIDMEKTMGERGDLEMSWEKIGEQVTPRKSTPLRSSLKPLTPLSASPSIRGEKGDETASETLLSAVVKSSPKRNKMGETYRSGTASPLSRSILRGSPGASQGPPSLRQSFGGVKRTASRSLVASRDASGAMSSPLSSKRPYQLPQASAVMQEEENMQDPRLAQPSFDTNIEEAAGGPYARLAEQLQDQLDQNNGNLSLDGILATKSPFRTLQNSQQASATSTGRQTSLSLSQPAHRYKATYEIGNAIEEKRAAQETSAADQDEEMQVDEVPRRRNARPARKTRGRVAPAPAKVAESEPDDDDASIPGSFPGRQSRAGSKAPQEERVKVTTAPTATTPSNVKRQSQRKSTRHILAPAERQDDEDEVPEMLATPTMKKSKSAAALSRSRSTSKLASTPVRRSARLSVEPEGTPRAASPTKERKSKRGTSKGPSLASASEKDETENEKEEDTSRTTRSRRASKMPGSF